jgi:hypothetical protein
MQRIELRDGWSEIVEAIRAGQSLRLVAERAGCSPGAIRAGLARTGEPPAHGRPGRRVVT